MTNTMNHAQFDVVRFARIALLVFVLSVGSLQVTRCTNSEDEDVAGAANDQYDRMHKITIFSGGN